MDIVSERFYWYSCAANVVVVIHTKISVEYCIILGQYL